LRLAHRRVARGKAVGQNRAIGTDELRKQVEQLEQELERAQQEAAETDAALAALDEQRRAREEQLELARRAEVDFVRKLDETRDQLARGQAEAALETYRSALAAREAAAEQFAAAGEAVAAQRRAYEVAQERVAEAWRDVVAHRHTATDAAVGELESPDDQPPTVQEAREKLVELVRDWHDRELEHDLVEAAARSPMGHEIENLPSHLRALARQRRGALVKQAQNRRKR
jgi:flagellar biosynthesis chaperone FliJ